MGTGDGDDEMMPLDEAAVRYGVSVRTLRRWIRNGRVPGYRFGQRQLRVKRKDLDAQVRPLGEECDGR